jgi:peptide/nickel transport system substrate-binding protein
MFLVFEGLYYKMCAFKRDFALDDCANRDRIGDRQSGHRVGGKGAYMTRSVDILREGFEYRFSVIDPVAGAHIDPPSTAMCETLVAKGLDGKAEPWLAARWEVSKDGLTWRFHLRPNLRFHSGAPCNAQAIVAALERCRWTDTRTRQLPYFDTYDSIWSEGDHVVIVRTLHPTTRVMQALWGTHSSIFNEATRQQWGAGLYGREAVDATGPYRLASWSDTCVIAEPSPVHTGQAPPCFGRSAERLHRIEWQAIVNESDRLGLLESGAIDCLHAPPAHAFTALATDPRFTTCSVQQSSNVYLGLNWVRRDLGFHEVEVRRALSLTIDRAALVRELLDGRGEVTYGPVPPGADFYHCDVDADGQHDPKLAGELLDAAGWSRDEDGLRRRAGQVLAFDCVVQDDSVLFGAGQMIRNQMRAQGIVLKLEPVPPFAPFYNRLTNGCDSFLSKWIWPDPIDALAGFTSTPCQPRSNWQRASVPRLDRAFDQFRQATDGASLAAAATSVQSIIATELPLIPLFSPHDLYVWRREIMGWRPLAQNLYPHYQCVERRRTEV